MEVKINRYRTALVISGTAVIAFGLWSVIRMFLAYTTIPEDLKNSLVGFDSGRTWNLVIIILVIFGLIILGLHAFIGLSARSEGIKGKRRYAYLVLTVLLIAVSVYGIIIEITSGTTDIFDLIVELIVSLTEIAAMAEMFIASVMLKRLSGKGH